MRARDKQDIEKIEIDFCSTPPGTQAVRTVKAVTLRSEEVVEITSSFKALLGYKSVAH